MPGIASWRSRRGADRARREAVGGAAEEFPAAAAELGLAGRRRAPLPAALRAGDRRELAAELLDRRETDLARGYTTHGPHLDELEISLGGRSLRRYGSQGEQRTALLALLFAERRALLEARRAPPLMLLDDVMSELDPDRRELLAQRLAEGGGQALLTATEPDQLPADCPRAELARPRGRRHGLAAVAEGRGGSAPRERPRLAPPVGGGSARGARAGRARRRSSRRSRAPGRTPPGAAVVARGRAGGGARRRGDDRLPHRDLGAGARSAPARALGAAQRGPRGGRSEAIDAPVASAPLHGRRPRHRD